MLSNNNNILVWLDRAAGRSLLLCVLLLVAVVLGAAQSWAFVGCALLSLVVLDARASLVEMRRESDAELLLQAVDRQNVALADCLRLVQLLRSAVVRERGLSAGGVDGRRIKCGRRFSRSESDLGLELGQESLGGGSGRNLLD